VPHQSPSPDRTRRGWTAWRATWLSILVATLGAVLVLAKMSADTAEDALATALADHLAAQATLAADDLRNVPVELLSTLGGDHVERELATELEHLQATTGLHDLALLHTDGRVLGSGGDWLVRPAENDLVARAAMGAAVTGPLYRDRVGDLYLTAYAPLPDHAGWVVAIEGSGAGLRAVDQLERRQLWVGLAVLIIAGALGAVMAGWVVRPIETLARSLAAVAPGDPPERVAVSGSSEVRGVATAARRLLQAIRDRDRAVTAAHQAELDQVTRIAAGIAHEVRNPLNAMALSTDRIATLPDPAERVQLAARLREQIEQLEAIIGRLVDLTKPIDPRPTDVDLRELVGDLEHESELELDVAIPGALSVRTDRGLVVQVLRNLLLNAAQAGATRARIDVERDAAGVRVSVTDDGNGIADSAETALFGWFETTRARGTGIGLPMSRRIAEALGGSLRLVSPRPACFSLWLPERP
jgi:signal transduction histidine kinase